jgi:hypothetical protein
MKTQLGGIHFSVKVHRVVQNWFGDQPKKFLHDSFMPLVKIYIGK